MNMIKLNRMRIYLIPFIAVFTAACSEDKQDLYTFIENTKNSTVGSVKPIPQFEPYESFSYSAGDLRDPFVASSELDEEESLTGGDESLDEPARPKQALEAFSLDSLAMVGTLEQGENKWGLIKDPQNVVHRVQIGNYMGQNEGRIIEISESGITLVEIIPDGIGGYIEREASIAIGNE